MLTLEQKIQRLKLKTSCKLLASKIKELKKLRKDPIYKGYVPGLDRTQNKYRHYHVAYCLLRGRTLEQIEQPKYASKLDMEYISWIQRAALPSSNEKLYVIVDETLTQSQQAVQAGHAVAEFLKKNPATLWNNGTLVYLKASFKWGPNIWGADSSAEFCEPDLGNKCTAKAFFDPRCELAFKNLKLV
jgi:hypothetical protein